MKKQWLKESSVGLNKTDAHKIKKTPECLHEVKDDVDLGRAHYQDLLPYTGEYQTTQAFLKDIFEMLFRYICQTNDRRSKVVDFHHPHQLLQDVEGFSLELTGEQESLEQLLVDCRDTLKYGVKTGHPRYFNQLSSGLDLVSLAAEWLTATANTNMFTFEIAPVFVLMEDMVLRKMREIIGWEEGDGTFSPGGTISNLYGAMLARQCALPQVKEKGLRQERQLVMFQSKHAHYSNRRPAVLLGIGSENCIDVEVDESGRMDPNDLQRKIAKASSEGKLPFYVSVTAGTTVLGAFDRIPEISAICRKTRLWLHVDAAWGGAVLLSQKHRHLMEGIHLADSVTWNPHKMMGVVLQCSAFLTKHKNALKNCNGMKADYLFQQDKHYDLSFDTGDSTIQCGRHVDVFKLWLAWRAKGDKGFEQHVDKCIELSRYLLKIIKKTEGFEVVLDNPQYANVCFWFVPTSIRTIQDQVAFSEKLHKVAPAIKKRMMESGRLMIGYQPLFEKVNFFRSVLSNPAVEREDLEFLVAEIARLGEELEL